jgi:adenylate kinase
MDIILFGMQGSGKGTQGTKLAEKYGLKFFEMGGELRKMIESGTPLGQKVKEIVEAGNLVDDDTVMEVVGSFIDEVGSDAAVLFDGIPRTVAQSEKLLDLLSKNNRDAFAVLIKISKEEAIKRLTQRRICEDYEKETVPVIKSFYGRDRLIEVDGEQAIQDVTKEMIEKVDYLFT